MILICSYCRKNLGEKEPYNDRSHSHGMCRDCYKIMMKQLDGITFDEYLDEFTTPVVIVDDEGRIVAANEMGLAMTGKPMSKMKGFLGGEALECQYARLPEGCGNTIHCDACTIRRLVLKTRYEKRPFNNESVFLTTREGKLKMIVSTSNIDEMVSISISEIKSC